MAAADEPPAPLPLTDGQLQPPIRRPPTALGTDESEPEWEDVRHHFPGFHLIEIPHSARGQAAFTCISPDRSILCDITVLLRSLWDPSAIVGWLATARAVQPLDLPCGPMVHQFGESDRFAYVSELCRLSGPLDLRLQEGGLNRAELAMVVESLVQTFAMLHHAGVSHGRLTMHSLGRWGQRIDLLDLLDPPPPSDQPGSGTPTVEDDVHQLATIFYTAATGRPWLGPGTAREFLDQSAAGGPLADAIIMSLDPRPGDSRPAVEMFRKALSPAFDLDAIVPVFGGMLWR